MAIDYRQAQQHLDEAFARVEQNELNGTPSPEVDESLVAAFELLFASKTQAFREVLLGCTIARIENPTIDITKPYVDQGEDAFTGRTLDEQVINRFLHDRNIPSSKGPFLSVFRRSVRFDEATRKGLRDKAGYDALLVCLDWLRKAKRPEDIVGFLEALLVCFLRLRESSRIDLARIHRMSLDQYDALVGNLLAIPSGGRLPLLLVVATFQAIKTFFALDWDITWQGINVADSQSGAGGDVTITDKETVVLVAEVTERKVDRARVVSTFNTKISKQGIDDYVFFSRPGVNPEAREQAHRYFAQGHEVNFMEIRPWISACLGTIGKRGRQQFAERFLELLHQKEIPKALKVAWNEQITKVIAS